MCKIKSPSFCVCNTGQPGPQTCGEGHSLSRPLGSLGSTSAVSEQGGSPLQCESEPWVLIKQVASRGPLLGQLTFIEHLLCARHIYSYPKFSEVPILQTRKMKHSEGSCTLMTGSTSKPKLVCLQGWNCKPLYLMARIPQVHLIL